ncbi:unnamed protein product [Symbiodinium sp. KB8]|nr:unnamed protein product [Symbiodinium sp. KB8]
MQHEILLRPHEEAYIKEHKLDLKRFHGMDLVFEARMRFLEMPPDERAKLCPGWLEEDQPLWQEGSIPLSSVIEGAVQAAQAAPFPEAPVVPLPAIEDAPAGGASSVASARGDAGEPGEEPAPEPGSAGAENERIERRTGPATFASTNVMSDLEAVQDVRSILEAAGGAN